MQNGPSIDWIAAEEIYEMYKYLYGCDQSLDVLASRGGFGWAEVELINKKYIDKRIRNKVWIF